MKKIDRDLFATGKTKSDKVFLKNLGEWIYQYHGNVNISQRLAIISIRERLGKT